ncbi:putative holin-like toxin [Paenibacillus sp. S-12]
MSVFESITLMIAFGTFVVVLISSIVTIISLQNSKKQP